METSSFFFCPLRADRFEGADAHQHQFDQQSRMSGYSILLIGFVGLALIKLGYTDDMTADQVINLALEGLFEAADEDSVHLCTQTSEMLKPLRRAVHDGASERKFLHQHKSMSDFRETFAISSTNTHLTKTVEIVLFCTTF